MGIADGYLDFAVQVLADLEPRGPLEQLAADQVVCSAWKLKGQLSRQAGGSRRDVAADPKARVRLTEVDRAARSLKESLEMFQILRRDFASRVTVTTLATEADDDIMPNEWPIVPSEANDEPIELPGEPEGSFPNWHERLVFDFDVSDRSPVVKGTWITVGHVVSLIVDGWSWADILRSHPELSEEDIRVCVSYAMTETNDLP